MSDQNKQASLEELQQLYKQGQLSEELYRAAWIGLCLDPDAISAQVEGSGAVAYGAGAVAAGAKGVAVRGSVIDSTIITDPAGNVHFRPWINHRWVIPHTPSNAV